MAARTPLIVVPDGLASDASGQALPSPSFVYRAVLDFVRHNLPGRVVYLAPANAFGGAVYEQEAAAHYLQGYDGTVITVPSRGAEYIDTRGNAAQLRDYLAAQGEWPLPSAILIGAALHLPRAALCFRKEAFALAGSVSVPYVVPAGETIVPRLWYYRYPALHRCYEMAARVRDIVRPPRIEAKG